MKSSELLMAAILMESKQKEMEIMAKKEEFFAKIDKIMNKSTSSLLEK